MKRTFLRSAILSATLSLCLFTAVVMIADNTAQPLPFSQAWTNTGLITTSDDWSGVPGIIGYRGDGLTASTAVDPQTVIADGTAAPTAVVDVNANQANPNTFTTGGVAEFAIADPVVALQGSGTADAPFILVNVITTGLQSITVAYNLRDVDGSADNAVQPVALQFRVGSSGTFTNVPAGFVSDASTGPSLATLVTPVSAILPAAADNQPLVQVRVITTDAVGSDEWIGVDDIQVTGFTVPVPTDPSGVGTATPGSVLPGGSTLLRVTVTPGTNPTSTGITVTGDLTEIGGSSSQPFLDDGLDGDAASGDYVFSYQATVSGATTPGNKVLPIAIADAQARAAATSIALAVTSSVVGSPDIVISQVYGGGGNAGATYTRDYIELFNRGTSSVAVTGWSVQYTSATGSTWQVTALSGSIQPGQYYLVHEGLGAGGTASLPAADATGGIAMSATNGKVALVTNQTALTCGGSTACLPSAVIRDFVGYGTADNFEGAAAAPGLTNPTAAFRASKGCTDTDNNSSDFASGTAFPNARNTSSPFHVCNGPSGVGAANPASVPAGGMSLLTVTVTPGFDPTSTGITVTGDLSAIGGSSSQPFLDDGMNGDQTSGDNVFSHQATVSAGTTPGNKSLLVTITDAQLRSDSTAIALTVEPPIVAIHTIQGSGTASPFVGQVVSTTGIVTGVKSNGFFIQDPSPDADSNTSEGILVFTSSAPPAGAAVGNSVKVTGTVQEFIPPQDLNSPPLTEIGGSPTLSVLSSGNPLPAEIALTSADTNPAGLIEQLEKFEGMRVSVASLTVVHGTGGSVSEPNATSTSNGVFYGVITGVARPFRQPGIEEPDPLPNPPCCIPRFDANPERLRVDSDALTGTSAIDVTAGATVTGLVGPLDYAFRTYSILPETGSSPVASGNVSATPVRAAAPDEFTVGSFNLERFYDTTDAPAPVGDVVLTPTAFNNRLNKASLAIRNVLQTPDILGVVEVENLPTLQSLATRINNDAVAAGQPNPGYVAYLEEGNDIGGIDVGFLVNDNRVDVVSVTQVGKDEMFAFPGSPTLPLNDRPSLVLRANVTAAGGLPYAVTVIVNHLRSLIGVDDPVDGPRVREKRRLQAEFLANLIQTHLSAGERVISVGDYNAFQFNDGYVDSIGTIKGTPTSANEVLLASSDLVNPDLTDLVDGAASDQQYSYLFDGNAQVLDHILVSSNILGRLRTFATARLDADFPEIFRSDPTRPERISDHDAPVSYFSLPQDVGIGKAANAPTITTGSNVTYTVTVTNNGVLPATNVNVADNLPASVTYVSCSSTADGVCGGTGNNRTVTYVSIPAGESRTITLVATVNCSVGDGATISNTATVSASSGNEDPSNDSASASVTASNPAPDITGASVDKPVLKKPNHKMVDITVSYGVTDNCPGTSCVLSVTSNEPVNGTDDGDTAPDWEIVDSHHVRVRNERSGTGTGRIYTITITCTDSAGRSSSRNVTVSVPK